MPIFFSVRIEWGGTYSTKSYTTIRLTRGKDLIDRSLVLRVFEIIKQCLLVSEGHHHCRVEAVVDDFSVVGQDRTCSDIYYPRDRRKALSNPDDMVTSEPVAWFLEPEDHDVMDTRNSPIRVP